MGESNRHGHWVSISQGRQRRGWVWPTWAAGIWDGKEEDGKNRPARAQHRKAGAEPQQGAELWGQDGPHSRGIPQPSGPLHLGG